MKLFKKIAILLALFVSASLFAADAPASAGNAPQANKITKTENGVTVSVLENSDGSVHLEISMDKNESLSCGEAYKRIVDTVMKALSAEKTKSVFGTISSLLKTAISDPNAPLDRPISIKVKFPKPTDASVMLASTEASIDGQKISAETKTTFNENGTSNTLGNMEVTSPSGVKAPMAPVMLTTDASGTVSGMVGDETLSDVSETEAANDITTPTSQRSVTGGPGADSTPVPNPTIVTSGSVSR